MANPETDELTEDLAQRRRAARRTAVILGVVAFLVFVTFIFLWGGR